MSCYYQIAGQLSYPLVLAESRRQLDHLKKLDRPEANRKLGFKLELELGLSLELG